ncbi:tetratricopeptide repeat protein [Lentisalinibacter salinarum]|uniref:tetratricopeptide repeat protein n=1 Tax=Lentisalinibacter salinarum TaxID=2992239 RepID=UPI0038696936
MSTSSAMELLRQGLEHHRAGRFGEAAELYRSALEAQPEHPDALYLLGVINLQTGDPGAALALLERAVAASPAQPEFRNTCGEAYRALGRTEAAMEQYRQAIRLNPGHAGAENNLGNAWRDRGRPDEALTHYRRAVELAPDFAMARNNLGVALKEQGATEEAIEQLARAIELAPDYAEAHSNLGNALQEAGRPEEAAASHRRAVDLQPGYAEAHLNLGNALRALHRSADALAAYERAASLRPDLPVVHYNRGIALDELSRPGEAARAYEQAIELDPGYAEAHHNLGNAYDQLGRNADAVACFRRAIELRPDYAEAYRNLSRLDPEADLAGPVAALLSEGRISEADAVHCHFALGNVHQAAGDFDAAFEHFAAGNRLRRKAVTYDSRQYGEYVDRLIASYSETLFRHPPVPGSGSERPVFIVGMPRSGTTLVEQIVSSHPQVHGAGELRTLVEIEAALSASGQGGDPYPECILTMDAALAREHASRYLAELHRHSADAARVTDKLPGNFVRIGLIRLLFPRARIVHCQRNALDTCISNFVHFFATGNQYSFDLRELGLYYRDYERLMQHWHRLFGDDLHTVEYEALLADQEGESRRLIRYLGLDWDARCLEFHENTRPVHVLSGHQVRRPIYTGSAGRWKRYERHLAPLIEVLETL